MSDATPQPPTLRRFLFGDDGLRAGWSLLLYLILMALLIVAGNKLIAHFHLLPPPPAKGAVQVPHDMTPRSTIIPEAVGFLSLLLAALIMALIERRPFSRYGFIATRMPQDFLAGLFWGVTTLSLLIGALFLTHSLAFEGIALHGQVAAIYATKWALVFLLVGLLEEFFTRGYLQYTVARGVAGLTRALSPTNQHTHVISFWVAAFIFSVCFFMAGHLGNKGETAAGIFAVGLAGAVFAFSLWRTGSLWWAVGIHASWDWAQSFLYGVADSGTHAQNHLLNTHPIGNPLLSGGTVGPEGSLLVIPTLLLTAVIIHFTLPRRNYPLTPDQTSVPIAETS